MERRPLPSAWDELLRTASAVRATRDLGVDAGAQTAAASGEPFARSR